MKTSNKYFTNEICLRLPHSFLVSGHKTGILYTKTLSQGLPASRKIVRSNNGREWPLRNPGSTPKGSTSLRLKTRDL